MLEISYPHLVILDPLREKTVTQISGDYGSGKPRRFKVSSRYISGVQFPFRRDS